MSDTLDLIPIAGFLGAGATKNVLNSFLMAIYDAETDSYIAMCKVGTGFTQELIDSIYKRFTPYFIKDIPDNYIFPQQMRPKYFFKPKEVWEIGFDCFTESLRYNLGKGVLDNEKTGLSIRFPRFLRFRDDKLTQDANNPEYILDLYYKTKNKNNH